MTLLLNYHKTKKSLCHLIFNVEFQNIEFKIKKKLSKYGPHKITTVHSLLPPDCEVRI